MKTAAKNKMKVENQKIVKCRVCGNLDLVPCVDIGEQYLSSVFPDTLDYRNKLKKYPMDLVLCRRKGPEHCGLLQLGHELDLSEMYAAYPYTSSSNSSMKAILQDVAQSGAALGHLSSGDLILDIGCNDGTLLSFFQGKRCPLLGVDAARNIRPVFTDPDFKFVHGFFSKEIFNKSVPKKAKLIFSIAMFYHLSDPLAFSRDAASCLDEEGAWIIQMAYLPSMIKANMYDNIVHEHNGYYGIETMQWIMGKAGLEIFDALLNDVYGGSFRLFVKHKGQKRFPATARLQALIQEERKTDLFEPTVYQDFDRRIQKTREDLRALLKKMKSENKKVWIYGASTKGNTILQYCEIGKEEIVAAADANPFKFGKYIIGADIPIRDEESMRAARPAYLLALPYSFVNAFVERESDLIRGGTQFIVPLPEVKIIP